jgi:succinate dehydrogenase / fumarate reductase flavoprotein subunit
MQGLADGYFVLPYTIGNYLATGHKGDVATDHAAFDEAEKAVSAKIDRLLKINGNRSADSFHRELGKIMWEHCGMARTKEGLETALEKIPKLREEFWKNVKVPGDSDDLNMALETAGRVADFLEFGELMCRDALERAESCGGHFRLESKTEEGEALRNDEDYCHAAVWEFKGEAETPALHKEPLEFEYVPLTQRSYK